MRDDIGRTDRTDSSGPLDADVPTQDGGFGFGRRSFVKGTTAIPVIGSKSLVDRGAAASGSYVVEQSRMENLQGEPSYAIGTDRGFYAWMTGRTLHLRWTGDTDVTGDVYIVEYHVQTNGAIESAARVQFESNEDSLEVGESSVSGRSAVGGGQDGVDVVLQNVTEITLDFATSEPIDQSRWRDLSDSEKRDLVRQTTTTRDPGMVFLGGDESSPDALPVTVGQTSVSTEVTPLSYANQTVDEFYGDSRTDSTTGVERSDVSVLFLYEGPDGLSLVAIHDTASDYSGGAVSFQFDGLPTSDGNWVVQDDPHDFDGSETEPLWSWGDGYKDGGAFRGGLADGFDVTVHPAFNGDATVDPSDPRSAGEIREWQFLSGDASNPERISLDMNSPVTIRSGDADDGDGAGEFERLREKKLGLASRIESASGDRIAEQPRVEQTLDALGSAVADGSISRGTAEEVARRMILAEEVTERSFVGIGPATPDDGGTDFNMAVQTSDFAVKTVINTLLSLLTSAKVLKKIPVAKNLVKSGLDQLSDYVDNFMRTLAGSFDFVAKRLRDDTSKVAEQLFEAILGGSVGTGSKLFDLIDEKGGPISDVIAGLVVNQVSTEVVEVESTDIDEALSSFDDAVDPSGGVEMSGSLSGARNAASSGRQAVTDRLASTKQNLDTLSSALDFADWAGLIVSVLAALTAFFGFGAVFAFAALLLDIAAILGSAAGAALGYLAIDDVRSIHADALDDVLAGATR